MTGFEINVAGGLIELPFVSSIAKKTVVYESGKNVLGAKFPLDDVIIIAPWSICLNITPFAIIQVKHNYRRDLGNMFH